MSEVAAVAIDEPIAPPTKRESNETFRLPRTLEILLGIVVVLELIIPFVTTTYGIDGGLHLNWIGQFNHLLSQGVWIPRWVPEGFWGFGSATFYFYPPITFYIAGLIHFVTGSNSVTFLYQMTGLVATIASVFSARLLLKELGAHRYQINVGAILFAFAPFRLAELYSRSSLSTHVAYALLPLVWLGVLWIVQERWTRRFSSVAFLGITLALLALTNVPMTMVTGVCSVIILIIKRRELSRRIVIDIFLAGLIALGLSAFHYTAVLAARPYARLEDLKPIDMEFLLTDLINKTGLAAGYHVALIYFAIAFVAFFYWRGVGRRAPLTTLEKFLSSIGIAILLLAALLEIPKYSLAIWYHVPPFPIIQFPWRFYAYIILASSLLVGIASTKPMQQASRSIAWLWTIGAIFPAILLVTNAHFFSHADRPIEDATEYRPVHSPDRKQLANLLSPLSATPFAVSFSSGASIKLVADDPREQRYSVSLSQPTEIIFHRFWWPYWKLNINQHELVVTYDSIGRATSVLPAGSYIASWSLQRSVMEQLGLGVTIVTSIILIIYFIILARKSVRNRLVPL